MITRKDQLLVGKPVVLIAEELSPATMEALGPDFEVRNCDGANRTELLAALGAGVDAVLIRSATKMDAEAIAASKGLKVIARAGVGVDNVDIPAATAAGIMVVNAPTSNIVSAAELAIALLLASARFISPAHAALRNGKWARSKYTGAELFEKTLGVVGFGKIGQLVAARMQAFGMNVVAYDPYLLPARAAQLGVRLVELDELLRVSDFITIHLPKTKETANLIGEEALKKVKQQFVLLMRLVVAFLMKLLCIPPLQRVELLALVSMFSQLNHALIHHFSHLIKLLRLLTLVHQLTRHKSVPESLLQFQFAKRFLVNLFQTHSM